MSDSELVTRYVRNARAAGVQVEFVSPDDLPGRLAALLSEFDSGHDCEHGGRSGNAGSADAFDDAPGVEALSPAEDSTTPAPGSLDASGGRDPADRRYVPVRLAALPATSWPSEVLNAVESALFESGFEIVSPQRTPEGYVRDSERLPQAVVGITFCAAYLADTGSIAFPAGPGASSLSALLPEVHVAVSYPDGCRQSLADYLPDLAGALPSRITLISGPSRTGDIEATMTTGVHGPRKVIHYILTNAG